MTEKEKKEEQSRFRESIIGANTTENVGRYGEAASEFIKGYKGNIADDETVIKKGLKQVSESKVNPDYKYANIKQQAGFSAEIHYVDKENADSIINKSNKRIYRSNDLGRGNDPVYDVLSVDEQGNLTWGAQMKFCGKYETPEEINNSAKNLVNKLAGDKWERYRDNKVLIPSEQYEKACEYAKEKSEQYLKQSEKFRQEGNFEKAEILKEKAKTYKQISSDLENSGISSKEAIFLREHPKLATAKYVTEKAHQSGIENAKSAAVLSGAISLSQNIVSVMNKEKTASEAVCDVGKDTAAGAVTAYILGAGDTAIRGAMNASKNEVFVNLSKTNMPSMIATASVQVGKSLIKYSKGEIDSLELMEELGEKGTGMMAASFGAAMGTLVLPGIGTVAGSMIGYMTSSTVYKSCMQILDEEIMSEERMKRIHSIASAAIESMEKQQQELLELSERFFENRKQIFEYNLDQIEIASKNNDLNLFTKGLNNIAIEMGETLQFKSFDEFDEFMLDDDSTFIF